MKQKLITCFCTCLALLAGISGSFRAAAQATSGAHVQYGISYNSALSRYEVYYQANSLAPANPPTVSTAQLFIVVPDPANGAAATPNGNYTVNSFTVNTSYANGTWQKQDYFNGPVENPTKDYFHVYLSSMGTTDIELNAINTPALLFTFTISGPCPGSLSVLESTDPLYFDPFSGNPPNSLSSNVNNNFDVLFPTMPTSTWNPGFLSTFMGPTPPCGVPTPVKLIDFDASKQGQTGLISWSTASEDNADYFGIERSADAKSWTTIARAKAAGTGSSIRKYAQQDLHPAGGVNYYRLRMADKDGSYAYSRVQSLTFDGGLSDGDIYMYPNPATGSVKFAGQQGAADLQIYAYDGRLVDSYKQFDLSSSLDVSKYATGTYQVRVMSNEQTHVLRMVVSH